MPNTRQRRPNTRFERFCLPPTSATSAKSPARSCAVCHTSAFLSALNVPFCRESCPCMANSADTTFQATVDPSAHSPGGPPVARRQRQDTASAYRKQEEILQRDLDRVYGKKRAHFEADIIACAVAPRARNDAGLKAYVSWSPGAAEAARVVGRNVQAQLAASRRHTRVAVDAVTRSPPDLDTLKKSELAHGASWCQRRLFSPRNWSSVRPSAARHTDGNNFSHGNT